jgi:hypothetical protein
MILLLQGVMYCAWRRFLDSLARRTVWYDSARSSCEITTTLAPPAFRYEVS